jgi:hypothetical protein
MNKLIKISLILIFILIIIVVVFLFYYVNYLRSAHSSFENYYKFRGCVQLINKTEDYGICKLESGKEIKIVKYNDKWYLDGDLPVSCGLFECP